MWVSREVAATSRTSAPPIWSNTHRGIMERSKMDFYRQPVPRRKVCRDNKHTRTKTIQKCEELPPDSNKAKLNVTELIVLDDQPLHAAENLGFWRSITHLEPHYTSPHGQLKSVKASVCKLIFKMLPWLVSLLTAGAQTSLPSLTAQTLDSGQPIATATTKTIKAWKTKKKTKRVHGILKREME